MTNVESADRLLKEAEHIFAEEISRCLNERAYNLAIRRAQEVVELALKAVIKFFGGDFPKVHDPAIAFIQLAPKKGLPISHAELARIQKISHGLAQDRAPAFYWEREYTKAEAEHARADAEFILNLARQIFSAQQSVQKRKEKKKASDA